MLRVTGRLTSYFDPTGLAAARREVRALRVVMIPAFAIETVCCSLRQFSCQGRTHTLRVDVSGTHHNFVQYTSCRVRHLVKLVNTTYATITQDKCTTGGEMSSEFKLMDKLSIPPLEHKLFRIWIPRNISCQADSRRSFSRRVDASGCKFVYILLLWGQD